MMALITSYLMPLRAVLLQVYVRALVEAMGLRWNHERRLRLGDIG